MSCMFYLLIRWFKSTVLHRWRLSEHINIW
nr:MAG TPA: hypothetical protein [Caudoviricetes sp.]